MTKAVRLYAQVLVDVVSAPNAPLPMSQVVQELGDFAKLFDESPMMLQVFDNPTMGDDDKQKALKEFFTRSKISPLAERFLSILIKRSRLGLLPEIIREVESIEVQKKGGLIGELTSAIPLEAGIADSVADALSKKLNKPVQLKQKIDPGIIAGMRVTIGGVTYDGSVKGKLDKMIQNFH